MEIGTGANDGQDSVSTHHAVTWHGFSLIAPTQSWSAVEFRAFAVPIIEQSWRDGRLPIIVGGTGLYHRMLLENARSPGPNAAIREKAAAMDVTALQQWLERIDATALAHLNHSDRHNPRRLVRAIEKATPHNHVPLLHGTALSPQPVHTVGMRIALSALPPLITERVVQRFQHGMIAEVNNLLHTCPNQFQPAWSATGYREIAAWLTGLCTKEEALARWVTREVQYAKRQMTWWKKLPDVQWVPFDDTQALDVSLAGIVPAQSSI
jgi:tRNA dimethylallyltransferase